MNLRTKLILIFVALALLPLVALIFVGYRGGVGAVEGSVRAGAEARAARAARRIGRVLDAQDSRLLELAGSDSLREYVRQRQASTPAVATASGAGAPASNGPARGASPDVPDAVRADFGTYFIDNRDILEAVTCLDPSGRPLFRVKSEAGAGGGGLNFQTTNFVSGEVRYDERVWNTRDANALRSPVAEGSNGAALALRITVPVFDSNSALPARPVAAVVAEVRPGDVIKREIGESSDGATVAPAGGEDGATTQTERAAVVVLDNASGTVVYNTNGAANRAASDSLPYFKDVAARMRSGAEGYGFYDAPDGDRWLAAFRQVGATKLSLAVSEDYAASVAPARRSFLFAAALALVACAAALALLLRIARQEALAVGRVARGASAIAAGNLEQRINVSASGEARDLAESFNTMSDRLRELVAREAESRQFQSFLRISAMVSHDLKNAIAGLSMLVTNMERQFHREEFRADAIESLREATEKLKRTVARLSEPAKSLSGEYRLKARQTDLVPLIRRVLAINAEPSRPLYDIEARLPDSLVATVEPERVENVVENLVINALEAMGAKGGKLTVEAGRLAGDYVFVGVSDTGAGMSDEFVKTRLFRPFSTTKNKGIGLGLFTCREIVEAHGGRLEVESKVGTGTRFRVVLPSRLFRSGERRVQT
ncbi:MAG TPA: ATP-binding protein [Pyrinomonadaceae bacterium]|nr:ATP-binding protein [Pyrinomonadaceae bacterium]